MSGPTYVRYANKKIFAVGWDEAKLHILDMELKTLKVVQHEFEEWISVMAADNQYVAIGECGPDVTVFDHEGNVLLVCYF